jgi:hypothetical protein
MKTLSDVEDDFDTFTITNPNMCKKCGKMHPIGTQLVWINPHCHLPGAVKNYEELKLITHQSASRIGWCVPCVLAMGNE